ncbi:MAG: tRNA lysidine(34) synthetase TilS [Clostridia bacterium]|nr:tRNA lysidine(34) synthetase TilS [Clostridia bacterium]
MTADIFCRILKEECGVVSGSHILAAVSGGADSVALLCLLDEARKRMEICVSCAHVEHGIRGTESEADLEFVRALCRERDIVFFETHVDAPAYAQENGCGLEDAARTLRYAFLEETRRRIGAHVIAVAHHAQDQAETVLMHAARGSDLRGLCAMRMLSGNVIRPLLWAEPAQLRRYLHGCAQAWREDATNEDTHYARNAVRHLVLPQLRRTYPGADGALARLAQCAQRDEDFFSRQIAALDLELIPLADGIAMEKAQICGLHDALLSRVLVRMVAAADVQASGYVVDRLIRALRKGEETAAASIGFCGGEAVQARFGELYLCITKPYRTIEETPLCLAGETKTPFGTFFVRNAQPGETGDGMRCQSVPRALLEGAAITARREGDAIVPFGRHTPVKVKKLLIDAGIERAMRRSVPVLRHGKDILWLPGVRASQLCRAQENDERMMITFQPKECVKIQ